MIIAPSFNDMVDQGRAEMRNRRKGLQVRDGDITSADLHAAAAMADYVVHYVTRCFAATWIDQCDDEDLPALANDHLNLQLIPATASQVILSFTRAAPGAAGPIPEGTSVSTLADATGQIATFQTDADFAVAAGDVGPFYIAATATGTGPQSNVGAATLTQIGATLFDTFTVTNPGPAGGGNDQETIAELRLRCHTWWQTLQRGTKAALIDGAKTVPTVRVATVAEDTSTGIATVMVSDADGNSTQQMIADVVAAEDNYKAAGVVVNVIGGHRAQVDLTIGLKVRPGFDVASVEPYLTNAVKTRLGRLTVNQALYHDMIKGAIVPLYPDSILRVTIEAVTMDGKVFDPAVDPIVSEAASAVIRPGTITIHDETKAVGT